MLGYLCAYYRHYNPVEFITSFLNNAANDEDIQNGTLLAKQRGIKIVQPKFGISKSDYFFNREKKIIAKGLSSIKYMGKAVADELYALSQNNKCTHFSDLLYDISHNTAIDSRQLDILIKLDFFSDFGNQRELFAINDIFELFKKGEAKQIKKDRVDGTQIEEFVKRHSNGRTKSGDESKNYTLLDVMAIVRECEDHLKTLGVNDLSITTKARNFKDIMGYAGYISGEESDRNKLFVTAIYPLKRKKDNELFGYSIVTQSIGSGKESRMTVFKRRFEKDPIRKDDIIVCKRWERDGKYFQLLDYEHLIA